MEILKADKNYKRKCFRIFFLLVAASVASIAFGLPKFEQLVASKPPEEAISILVNSLVVILLSFFVPFGFYFCLFAWRILKSEQFPPPGQKVFKDTLIHRGVKAKWRSYVFFGSGVLMIAFAVIFTLMLPSFIDGLAGG